MFNIIFNAKRKITQSYKEVIKVHQTALYEHSVLKYLTMNPETNYNPSLEEILRGYQRFDEWREAEEFRTLPKLSIEESLNKFFDLCNLVRPMRADSETRLKWKIEELDEWIRLNNRYIALSNKR